MSVDLDDAQVRNAAAAMAAADRWTATHGDELWAVRDRVAFACWTESRFYNDANDGSNTSRSPGFGPNTATILRLSMNLPHDRVGNNGRSTGVLQQTSTEVGGVWGSMVGTMDVTTAVNRFLMVMHITNFPMYSGTLLTSNGQRTVVVNLSSPIAADVLRVQQPLADEAESSNYGAAQVATAQAIARDPRFAPAQTDWLTVATQAEVKQAFADAIAEAPIINRIANQVYALNADNVLEGLPYGKQAAGFNDVRALRLVVDEVLARLRGDVARPWDNVQDLQSLANQAHAALERLEHAAGTDDPTPAPPPKAA